MNALMQLGVTLALLGSVWLGLGLVALSAGVLPARVSPEDLSADSTGFDPHANDGAQPNPVDAPSQEPESPTEASRTRPSDPSAPGSLPSPADPEASAVVPSHVGLEPEIASSPSSTASARPTRNFALDPPGSNYHVLSLVTGQLLGDELPELVVGLGDRFEVLRTLPDGGLERVAIVRVESPDPTFSASSPRAAIGDVTGDGVPDLVVAFWLRSYGGGSRGGGAWLLRGKADGTLDRPRQFCGPRVMASSVSLVDVDGRGGLDVVVADRGRPYGAINGRVFVYAGGRMPRLLREIHTDIKDVRFVLPADANGDERTDLVVAGETVVRYENTGRGRFEPMEGLHPGILFADTPYGFSGDLNGDGRLEAYVVTNNGEGGTLIIESTGTRFLPRERFARGDDARLHAIRAALDIDGDGRAEVLARRSVGYDWAIGFFSAEGEPVRLVGSRRQGVILTGHDGALLRAPDGSVERVSLDNVYDGATRESHWRIARASVCIDCPEQQPESAEIRTSQAPTEWTVR